MKHFIKILACVLILLWTVPAWGATYYVDATLGDDDDAGDIDHPWQTIAKVNASSFNPGDNVYFKRGEVWREQLTVPSSGSAGNPITFGAYGTGADPVISGADVVTSLTNHAGDVYYKAGITTEPNMVFYDGTILTENDGATTGVGANEWDWASDTLYINVGEDPVGGSVEISQRTAGIYGSAKNYITVQGISIKYVQEIGVYNLNGTNWIVDGNTVLYAYNDGINMYSNNAETPVTSCVVNDNSVSYSGDCGIYAGMYGAYGTISENIIHHNCWRTDKDTNGGIKIYSGPFESEDPDNVSSWTISENESYSNGVASGSRGAGIWVDYSNSNIISRNLVHDNAFVGIYVEKSDSNSVIYNIVHDHTASHVSLAGHSIVVSMSDNNASSVDDNLVYNNTIYNSRKGLFIYGLAGGAGTINNTLVKNNIIEASSVNDIDHDLNGRGTGTVYANNCLGAESISVNWEGSEKTTYDDWETAYGGTTASAEADPLFVNAAGGDFRLPAGSPCIDAGTDVGLTEDYAGNTVPRGFTPDIGAYEVQSNYNCTDYTSGWVETDEDSDITITSETITVDTIRRDAVSYVRKDYGAGYFGTSFTHYGYVNASAFSGGAGAFAYWAVSQAPLDSIAAMVAANDGIILRWSVSVGQTSTSLVIIDYDTDNSDPLAFSVSPYLPGEVWFKVTRDGSTLDVDLYSDSGYSTLIPNGDLQITISESDTFRYLYGAIGAGTEDAYAASTVTAQVGCLNITPNQCKFQGGIMQGASLQ